MLFVGTILSSHSAGKKSKIKLFHPTACPRFIQLLFFLSPNKYKLTCSRWGDLSHWKSSLVKTRFMVLDVGYKHCMYVLDELDAGSQQLLWHSHTHAEKMSSGDVSGDI